MQTEDHCLLKLNRVLDLCAISRSTLYEMVARNEFPGPVQVGVRAVAWRQRDIFEWIESRPQATNSNQPSQRKEGE